MGHTAPLFLFFSWAGAGLRMMGSTAFPAIPISVACAPIMLARPRQAHDVKGQIL
ncbi:hypothetical protein C4K38_2280 [Pseudomonas chlororaphis subsp. piscium]|nr:hypothetical protein C4K38_2280 [Pseudomonas chlororaphis subsp. piscium]